jgi:flavin reductase (DIM6/NTAB) family NADH-FMN oxidoreductase RutF
MYGMRSLFFCRSRLTINDCSEQLYDAKDLCLPPSNIPTTTVILGLIRKVHVRESVLSEDKKTVDPSKLHCVSRLGGTTYARLLEGFDVPRVTWKS